MKSNIERILPPSRSSHLDASKHINVEQKSQVQNLTPVQCHDAKVGFDHEMPNLSFRAGDRRNGSGRWAQYQNSTWI